MNTGDQVEFWRDYYEDAWKFRTDYMMDLIEQGENCPYRVIQSLGNHERHFYSAKVRDKFIWAKQTVNDDPKDLLPSGFPSLQPSIIRGHPVPTPYYSRVEGFRLIIDLLVDGDFDCVVDLGAGCGKTLLEIFYNGGPRNLTYIGAELTESGCQSMRKLLSMAPGAKWEVHQFDLLAPDFSFLAPYKRILFITVHAIQMVKEISMKLLENMAASAEYVKTVHLEPFGFQLEPNLGPGTTHQSKQTVNKCWNINLGPLLVKAHKAGTINCTYLASEIMGGGDDPQSIAVWEAGTGSKSP